MGSVVNLKQDELPGNFVEGAEDKDEVDGDAAYRGRHLEGDRGEAAKDLVERAEERRRADVEVRLERIALVQMNVS